MLLLYLAGIFIITVIVFMVYLYEAKSHEIELKRIDIIEKKMQEARSQTVACPINNLNDPRSCYMKSDHTCSWNEKAGRCDKI